MNYTHGRLTQLVECHFDVVKVGDSSSSSPTKKGFQVILKVFFMRLLITLHFMLHYRDRMILLGVYDEALRSKILRKTKPLKNFSEQSPQDLAEQNLGFYWLYTLLNHMISIWNGFRHQKAVKPVLPA